MVLLDMPLPGVLPAPPYCLLQLHTQSSAAEDEKRVCSIQSVPLQQKYAAEAGTMSAQAMSIVTSLHIFLYWYISLVPESGSCIHA